MVTLIMTNVILYSRISFLFFLPPFRLYLGPDLSLSSKISTIKILVGKKNTEVSLCTLDDE